MHNKGIFFAEDLNRRISTLELQVAYQEDTSFYTPDSWTSFCASSICKTSLASSQGYSSRSSQSWWVCSLLQSNVVGGQFLSSLMECPRYGCITFKAGTINLNKLPENLILMYMTWLNSNKHTQSFPVLSWQLVLNHQKGKGENRPSQRIRKLKNKRRHLI